jgi:hypothetical protein
VRASGLSIARGEAMLLDDHRVLAPYVDAEALIYRRRVRNFALSIRGIGIDRKLRWTGFGPKGDVDGIGMTARKRSMGD